MIFQNIYHKNSGGKRKSLVIFQKGLVESTYSRNIDSKLLKVEAGAHPITSDPT